MEPLGTRVINWLLEGEVGLSSKAMAARWWGRRPTPSYHANFNPRAHPLDPADLRRCLLLLDFIPEGRNRLDELRELSPAWNAIVDHWDELEDTFIAEAGPDWRDPACLWSARRTYALMRKILGD